MPLQMAKLVGWDRTEADTLETLEARVHAVEHRLLVDTLARVVAAAQAVG